MSAIGLNPYQAGDIVDACVMDPLWHIEEIQGCKTLEPYQRKIIKAISLHDRIVIKSCHDMGKTFTMAKIVLALGSINPNTKIITTAPTFNQVKRLLWSEIRSGWRRSKVPLGGTMLTTEWKIDDDWFAVGFTSRGDSDASEGQGMSSSFQGFHASQVIILFDEAMGIPRNIWDQSEGMMTSANVKMIAIGNPTSRQGEFFKCFKDPQWHKIHLSCFDSPNMIANGFIDLETIKDEIYLIKSLNDDEAQARFKQYKTVHAQLLHPRWAIAMAIKWGLNHPLFVSKVLGDFPEEDENVMISLATVEEAQYRHQSTKRIASQTVTRSIGIDPARYGPDNTVITVLEDNYQTLKKTLPKGPTTDTVNFIVGLVKSLTRVRNENITIDGTGLGAGVVDGLRQAQNMSALPGNIVIKEIHFGAQCEDVEDKEHFANLKAKMFKVLADSLKNDLAILPENVYLEELPMIIYSFTPKGQLIIESKDDYKKRTGLGSPDSSDSLALANFGRVDTGRVGVFSEKMIQKTNKPRTLVPGLGGGSNW